jgi:hypothetical protein
MHDNMNDIDMYQRYSGVGSKSKGRGDGSPNRGDLQNVVFEEIGTFTFSVLSVQNAR